MEFVNPNGSRNLPKKYKDLHEKLHEFIEKEKNYKCKSTESFADILYGRLIKKPINQVDRLYAESLMKDYLCMADGSEPNRQSAKFANEDLKFKGQEHVF